MLKQALEKGQPVRVILRNYRKDGGLFWNELHVSPLIDATGNVTHFIGVIIDITAQKFLENQLMHQATHDTLTGLPNRLLLLDRIEQAVLHAKRNEKILPSYFSIWISLNTSMILWGIK
ncbi:MAG: PAS domain S-box protein [Coxiellaceae bacterium]|nr:MAG: PAS domain S-box protein [Coxiellaceae bacterium]